VTPSGLTTSRLRSNGGVGYCDTSDLSLGMFGIAIVRLPETQRYAVIRRRPPRAHYYADILHTFAASPPLADSGILAPEVHLGGLHG